MDCATRYKMCALIPDRTAESILKGLFRRWISIFGPPMVCVSDQEAAITSDKVATDFERLSIFRRPKGSDPQGKHTGTGGIERHVALTKLTMLKVREELEGQGIVLEMEDLGNEAAMAQNFTIEYGGVTPCMAALGMHPRGFHEFEDATMTSIMGAAESSCDLFENALRARMASTAKVRQAIVEERLQRANTTRPQQHDLGELVPGKRNVELLRVPLRVGSERHDLDLRLERSGRFIG